MATNIYWPTTLPQQMLMDGYSEQHEDNFIRTQMDAARPKQRARYPNILIAVQGNFLLTTAQKAIFLDFFENTLSGGVSEFYIPQRGNNLAYDTVQFTDGQSGSNGVYQFAPNNQYWILTVNIEILP